MTGSQQRASEAYAETSGAPAAKDEGGGLPDVLYRGSHVAAKRWNKCRPCWIRAIASNKELPGDCMAKPPAVPSVHQRKNH
jgi:hypothetical protein